MNLLIQNKGILLLFTFVLFFTMDGMTQPPPPGGTGPPCWPPPCIPIDGGIGWLLAAGVAYGAKKSWDFGKKNKEEKIEE